MVVEYRIDDGQQMFGWTIGTVFRAGQSGVGGRRVTSIHHSLLADRDWLIEQYSTSTATDVAALIGVHPATVSRALRTHGIVAHSRADTQRLLRRPELDDADWLRQNYLSRSMASIADELGVSEAAVQTAMVRMGVERRAPAETQILHRSPLLDDPEALAEALSVSSVVDIATSVGVAVPTVQIAMRQHGVKSPWKFNGIASMDRPPTTELVGAWEAEQTIKGVARRFGVSVNTAAIWLARVGMFVSDVPSISRPDLESAIERGESIDAIRRRHRVTDRTVVGELYRHGLFEAHRRRHMSD